MPKFLKVRYSITNFKEWGYSEVLIPQAKTEACIVSRPKLTCPDGIAR